MSQSLGETELWAAAEEIINATGEDAAIYAAMEADRMLEEGDMDGAHDWRIVTRRIGVLIARRSAPLH